MLPPLPSGAACVSMLDAELLAYNLLPDNATRYELLRATASSADRRAMWTAWSAISFITALCSCSLYIAVLSSRKARASVFNLYLAAFMLPDFVFSCFCFITCWVNASHGEYVGGGMCEWQSFYLIFGVTGSCWLNGFIAHEVYTLLSKTVALKPYQPPSRGAWC